MSSRWLSLLHRHHLFLILMFGVMFFFYYLNLKEMSPDSNSKLRIQNHSTMLFTPTRRPNVVSLNTSATPTAAVKTTEAYLAVFDQTQTTVTSEVTLQTPNTSQMPTPYVSTAPYLVEYPYEYHFVINEAQKCEQDKPFMVLLVHVAPLNRRYRDVIRSTWGSEDLVHDKVVKVFFLLGVRTGEGTQDLHQQLLQESKEHRDLIQSDFVDCYKNLTIKTMVMLEWLNSYCSNVSYAMKIDSDTFLNMPNLISMLLEAPRTNYMTGLLVHRAGAIRNPTSKWYMPEHVYPRSSYPTYTMGLGYIFSLDLPKKLIEASRHVKALYIEDVYLGLCMQHLGIAPTNPPGNGYFHDHPLEYSRCDYSKIVVTTIHPYIDRVWLWEDFKRPDPYC